MQGTDIIFSKIVLNYFIRIKNDSTVYNKLTFKLYDYATYFFLMIFQIIVFDLRFPGNSVER